MSFVRNPKIFRAGAMEKVWEEAQEVEEFFPGDKIVRHPSNGGYEIKRTLIHLTNDGCTRLVERGRNRVSH